MFETRQKLKQDLSSSEEDFTYNMSCSNNKDEDYIPEKYIKQKNKFS